MMIKSHMPNNLAHNGKLTTLISYAVKNGLYPFSLLNIRMPYNNIIMRRPVNNKLG